MRRKLDPHLAIDALTRLGWSRPTPLRRNQDGYSRIQHAYSMKDSSGQVQRLEFKGQEKIGKKINGKDYYWIGIQQRWFQLLDYVVFWAINESTMFVIPVPFLVQRLDLATAHIDAKSKRWHVCLSFLRGGAELFDLKSQNSFDVTAFARPFGLRAQLEESQAIPPPLTPDQLRRIQRILQSYERPSHITRIVKRRRQYTCQLCQAPGFLKRNGKRYCEVHHLFHLSNNPPPRCLGPEYLVVLCATCHRRIHYSEVGEPVRAEDGWAIRIDDTEYRFVTV